MGMVVQDSDDEMKRMFLPRYDVRRLDDAGSGLHQGERVLAVFPDTTAFYPGHLVLPYNPLNPKVISILG